MSIGTRIQVEKMLCLKLDATSMRIFLIDGGEQENL